MKIYVIAGNKEQANSWIKSNLDKRMKSGETTLSWSDYVYLDSPLKLRGVQDPRGVFIGTWRDRPDIEELVDALFIACIHVNRALERVRSEIKLKSIRPTPFTWKETQQSDS
jgi:hypothetical protein